MQRIAAQVWAVILRYVITLYRSPISSALRLLLWPAVNLYICYYILNNVDPALAGSAGLLLSLLVLALVAPNIYHFVSLLATDKETGMRSLMMSMGLNRYSYYLAQVFCITTTILPIVIVLACLSIEYVYKESQASPITIFLVFLVFVLHINGWILVFSSFITSSRYASLVIIPLALESLLHQAILWILSKSSESWRPVVIFGASIWPFESIRILRESYDLCKHCNDIQFKDNLISEPLYLLLISMSVWTLVAFAFTRWFDEVCPWQTDYAKKGPFFCLNFATKEADFNEALQPRNSKYFEKVRENREVGIQIKGLSKKYNDKYVVSDISFNIYRGETTLLLGHNGAGKTTLMNMILNRVTPDQGQIKINHSTSGAFNQSAVGICPQNSILDENLTVRQHLELFAGIKYSSASPTFDKKRHIETTIKDVSLNGHENKLPSSLSGGMKRKLSLGMAFVGHSTILILDEPSSGLDPDSRMFVWNAIRRYRENRTVLLSTQHMEEADYLGDRIAIMNNGRIICCGSSTFLNNTFGSGYKLRIECHDSARPQILSFVRGHFAGAKETESLAINVTPELSRSSQRSNDPVMEMIIELRGQEDGVSIDSQEIKMISLIESIELKAKSLGILSHGLRSSSIEDVLLKTGNIDLGIDSHHVVKISSSMTPELMSQLRSSSISMNDDYTSQCTYITAMMIKLFHSYRRDWFSILLLRIIVPVAITAAIVYHLDSDSFMPATYKPDIIFAILVIHLPYYPTMERASKFKIVQLTSKSNFVAYWISHLLMDLLSIVVIIVAFDVLIWVRFGGILVQSTVYMILPPALLLFGISAALFAYLMSSFYNNASSSTGYHLIVYVISIGVDFFITLLGLTIKRDVTEGRSVLSYIFIAIYPTDALSYFLYGVESECYLEARTDRNPCVSKDQFSPISLGLIILGAQIIFYSTIIYLIEWKNIDLQSYINLAHCNWTRRRLFVPSEQLIDEDVVEETTKAISLIKNASTNTHSLIVADVNKSYVRGVKVVEHLSLTVRKGECFGLLGVNGAGKSTTFSMIVAESQPDAGCIWMNGRFNNDSVTAYRNKLGYGPQCNPETSMSPYEALYLMARLRGVNESRIGATVATILEILNMAEHSHKSAKDLSGGTQRKLTLGLALIGNPSLLALDEPTAGVDPIARRSIWELLRSLRARNGVSIIISSHAMEECEAICNRISIMARGRLRCVGSFLHLRSKFSQGCSIKVQFSDSGSTIPTNKIVSELTARLESSLGPSVKLADTNINSATFNVIDNKVKRSVLFKIMREFRLKYSNLSYMINDSSLEDIFIALAQEQQQLDAQLV